MKRYNPKEIESKWQKTWEDSEIYQASESNTKPKKYVLEYFPYPSGAAMHVGHVRNYTIGDAIARHSRMKGFNVLHPMGWDAFGLPAENYAIKNGISPRVAIDQNTTRFKQQLMQMGFSYDWSREIDSTDPKYYRWTQWFFIMLFKKGLAYQQESLQWWCPHDKTVLANEQVENGLCWRCGNPVEKKSLKQWFFKITDYADRLLNDLEDLDWSEAIKSMQRNWIGRSEGAEIDFTVGDTQLEVKDTLKFTPVLTAQIQSGAKTSTVRLESKNLQVGDYAKLITRYSATETRAFAVAKVTAVRKKQLQDIDLKMKGHETYDAQDEMLTAYRDYYGPEVSLETEFVIYDFKVISNVITVFTTRPDTLFGATFMVLAPEHPMVQTITTAEQKSSVEEYARQTQAKSEIERQETNREKTGVFTGAYAINPVNGAKLPIWIADYVMAGYGTGAIMAVPAHDERDFTFAKKFDLPVIPVVEPVAGEKQGDEVEKEGIIAIVRNPEDNKLLVLDWGPRMERWGGNLFVGGGADSGEDLVECAKREIKEETGYKNLKHVSTTNYDIHCYYFSNVKNKNYYAKVKGLLFDLVDVSKDDVNLDEGEKNKFITKWLTVSEADRLIDDGAHRAVFGALIKNESYHGEGVMTNSGDYDGLSSSDAREKIVADLQSKSLGQEVTNYKMRDWLISRQRYWGTPIPIIHCGADGAVAVPEDQLPVLLPDLESFEPSGDGHSPLANVPEFVNTTCPKCGGPAKRETDTMDGFACSSWYFLRFADPHNDQKPFDKPKVDFWLPVDDYIGGAEHAVMHLLYARFWTKVMFDEKMIDFEEPFSTLRNHGMILAPDGNKMSKSKNNTIEPDSLIEQGYGADSIRILELFIGPWNQMANWSVDGLGGSFRFLQRIWTLVQEFNEAEGAGSGVESLELKRSLHKTIKKVSEDMHELGLNTAIASLMECVNDLFKVKAEDKYSSSDWKWALQTLLQLLAPFAPHITEELWQELGNKTSIHTSDWPKHDEKYLASDTMTIVVQVNGKLRAELKVDKGANEAQITEAALAEPKVQAAVDGQTIRKTIYIPNKLVNLVV